MDYKIKQKIPIDAYGEISLYVIAKAKCRKGSTIKGIIPYWYASCSDEVIIKILKETLDFS